MDNEGKGAGARRPSSATDPHWPCHPLHPGSSGPCCPCLSQRAGGQGRYPQYLVQRWKHVGWQKTGRLYHPFVGNLQSWLCVFLPSAPDPRAPTVPLPFSRWTSVSRPSDVAGLHNQIVFLKITVSMVKSPLRWRTPLSVEESYIQEQSVGKCSEIDQVQLTSTRVGVQRLPTFVDRKAWLFFVIKGLFACLTSDKRLFQLDLCWEYFVRHDKERTHQDMKKRLRLNIRTRAYLRVQLWRPSFACWNWSWKSSDYLSTVQPLCTVDSWNHYSVVHTRLWEATENWTVWRNLSLVGLRERTQRQKCPQPTASITLEVCSSCKVLQIINAIRIWWKLTCRLIAEAMMMMIMPLVVFNFSQQHYWWND